MRSTLMRMYLANHRSQMYKAFILDAFDIMKLTF